MSLDTIAVPLERWEGRSAAELAEKWQLPQVILLSEVGSTNDFARTLAASGAVAWTAVLAEEQTTGRGRSGRRWASPRGLGLYLSFVARPEPAALPTYPLRTALAIAQALDPWTADRSEIKWPNDLLLEGRKLGGILCEAAWAGEAPDYAIIGIGLNVLHSPEDFPPDLQDTATSIRSIAGEVSRLEIATAVASRMADLITPSRDHGELLDTEAIAELNRRHAYRGQRVDVIEPASGRILHSGYVEEIAADGTLGIRDGQRLLAIRSGTLRLSGSIPD